MDTNNDICICEADDYKSKYHNLLNSIASGFTLMQMIYDENGKPLDCRYIEVSPSHERLTGLKTEDIIGKTVKECIHGLEERWIQFYNEVVKTGTHGITEDYVHGLNKWFKVSARKCTNDCVAVTFEDITDTKVLSLKIL